MVWILLIISLASLFGLAYYRLQIQLLVKQLKEMSKLSTNQLLTQEIFSKEMIELVQEINQTIAKERNLRIRLLQQETNNKALMSNLSHDVRTPLTSLIGYIQLLEESDSPEDQDRYFKIIYQRLDRLKDLLDRLFLLARLEDRDYQVRKTSLDLKEIVSQAILSSYDQLTRQAFEVDVDIQAQDMMMEGNQDLIHAIMDNLIKNAIDHGKAYLKLSLHQDQQAIILQVSNQVKEAIEGDPSRWLERFYQGDPSRTKGNSGLGLSIIKSAAEKMGGSVSIKLLQDQLTIQLIFPKSNNKEEAYVGS